MSRNCQKRRMWMGLAGVMVLTAVGVQGVRADAFSDYALSSERSFSLPEGASVFDVLGDGSLVTLSGTNVFVETAPGSRNFSNLGTLVDADFNSYGAAFLRVSPDGTRLAVGNNGGSLYNRYQVGVFSFNRIDFTGDCDWFDVSHYDAEWIDNTDLALTACVSGHPSIVTALDTTISTGSPTNPTIIENIGGSSSGIAFDAAGNLYTGNGYDSVGAGDSETGWIKAFTPAEWQAGLSGGSPADFENGGMLIAELLSATSLGFDLEGNLHVGGGDFGEPDYNNAALAHHTAIAEALAGLGELDSSASSSEVRRFDPDSIHSYNYYDVNYNEYEEELYIREGTAVYTYVVPEPASLVLALACVVAVASAPRGRRG